VPGAQDLRVGAAVEQNQKAETCRLEGLALSCPGIGLGARRIIQPIAGVREGLTEKLQIRVAGIIVAIKAEVSGGRGRARLGTRRVINTACKECSRHRNYQPGFHFGVPAALGFRAKMYALWLWYSISGAYGPRSMISSIASPAFSK